MCIKCTEPLISSEWSCKAEGQMESDLDFKVKHLQNTKEGTNKDQVTQKASKKCHYKTIQTKKRNQIYKGIQQEKDIFMNM